MPVPSSSKEQRCADSAARESAALTICVLVNEVSLAPEGAPLRLFSFTHEGGSCARPNFHGRFSNQGPHPSSPLPCEKCRVAQDVVLGGSADDTKEGRVRREHDWPQSNTTRHPTPSTFCQTLVHVERRGSLETCCAAGTFRIQKVSGVRDLKSCAKAYSRVLLASEMAVGLELSVHH